MLIKRYIPHIIIAILMLIIVLETCNCNKKYTANPATNTTTIKYDTVYLTKESVIFSKPQLIKTTKYINGSTDTLWISELKHDTLINDYGGCDYQNIYSDTLRVDSTALFSVLDTVQGNRLIGRKFAYKLHLPVSVSTTTITPTKRQFYFGVGIAGNKQGFINQFNTGLIYKDKKDNILHGQVGIGWDGNLQFGISKYWKIHL